MYTAPNTKMSEGFEERRILATALPSWISAISPGESCICERRNSSGLGGCCPWQAREAQKITATDLSHVPKTMGWAVRGPVTVQNPFLCPVFPRYRRSAMPLHLYPRKTQSRGLVWERLARGFVLCSSPKGASPSARVSSIHELPLPDVH